MLPPKNKAPRVEYAMPAQVYRDSEGMSHSESKNLRKSPYHYHEIKHAPPQLLKPPSAQMMLGTLTHAAVLEPAEFDRRYLVGPEVNKNSNVWKEFVAACQDSGATPISQDQREQAFNMASSVLRLADFQPLLQACATEVSMWWHCPTTGVLCKARPDLVKRYPPGIRVVDADPAVAQLAYERGFAMLADLKTTENANPREFARSVAAFSYHTQASWYCEGAAHALGVPVLSMLFVVVERDFPYVAASYTLDDNAMRVAADINQSARKLYLECSVANEWPAYQSETTDIALPSWYMKQYLAGDPI